MRRRRQSSRLTPATVGELTSFDPNLESPYTLQWNVAVEQALGTQQTLSVSYVGAAGRRLVQTASIDSPNRTWLRLYW